VVNRRVTISIAVLLAFLATSFAVGQDLDDFSRPRRMVYFFQADPGSLESFDEFLLYNAILSSIGTSNPDVVVLESPDRAVPVGQEGREDLARRVDADSWVYVFAAGGMADLSVVAEVYDMRNQVRFDPVESTPGFPISYRALAIGLWDDIAAVIRDNFESVVDAEDVLFRGVPGTQINGLPGSPFIIDEDGSVVVPLPSPATFEGEASLAGFETTTERVYVGFEAPVVEFSQRRLPQFAVDFRLSSFQFPGARFWWFFVPSQAFLRGGITTQLIGLYLVNNAGSLFDSSALSTVYVDAGYVFGSPEDSTRLWAGGGASLRLSHQPQIIGLDRDAAFGGVHLSLGAEIKPLRQLALFADYQPTFLLAPSPEQFIERSFTWNAFPDGNAPGFITLPWGLFDLRNLYLGVRLSW